MDLKRYSEEFKKESAEAGFFLDFDGTLSRIVSAPGGATLLPQARPVLQELARVFAVVAMISGRRAADLAERVAASGVSYLGLYGAEKIEEGHLIQPLAAEIWRGMASRLARDAQALINMQGLTGCEVEFKDLAVSIHYRGAENPKAGEVLLDWAKEIGSKRKFSANLGRKVVELKPVEVSKAVALEQIAVEKGLRWIVAAGDDSADVEALDRAGMLVGPRALKIGVTSAESPHGLEEVSDVLVNSPEELLKLLRLFLPSGNVGETAENEAQLS